MNGLSITFLTVRSIHSRLVNVRIGRVQRSTFMRTINFRMSFLDLCDGHLFLTDMRFIFNF